MALYAFCREVDDVVDECQDPALAATKLAWWRTEVDRVFDGNYVGEIGLAAMNAAIPFNTLIFAFPVSEVFGMVFAAALMSGEYRRLRRLQAAEEEGTALAATAGAPSVEVEP